MSQVWKAGPEEQCAVEWGRQQVSQASVWGQYCIGPFIKVAGLSHVKSIRY